MPRTILLADDSVTIQKVVEITFMDEDFGIVAVGDGDAALAKLDEITPDVLILDVHMPGADGYEVCRRAKERLHGVPVLLLVGTFESFDEAQAASCGADGHLKKPFEAEDLLRRVQELVGRGGEAPAASEPAPEPAFDLEPPPEPPPAPAPASVEPAPSAAAADVAAATQPTAAHPAAPGEASAGHAGGNGLAGPLSEPLSDGDVDRIARRVAELVGDKALRDVAWEVVPDLAEVIIRERIRELEEQVE